MAETSAEWIHPKKEEQVKPVVIGDFFSREVWVETNQKNAIQQGGACGVGRLYSCASQPVSDRVTWYRAELTRVAKKILRLSEVVQAKLAMAKR
jgi:hypothetical protein